MEIDYESDSAQGFSNDQLSELSVLAKMQLDLEAAIDETERELAALKKQHKQLAEVSIPDLMQQVGMAEFTLDNGYKVTVKPFYGANINDENREQCFAWLRDHELGDIIKHEVTAKLGKDSDKAATQIVGYLASIGVDYADKEFVHPMTLKSFVKEQCEENTEFPKDMFKVFEGKLTKITRRK